LTLTFLLTTAAKAMYSQFGKKTILIASKIMEGRNNNPVLNEDEDNVDEDEDGGLVVLVSFFFLLLN
jgi:hypothetical protein